MQALTDNDSKYNSRIIYPNVCFPSLNIRDNHLYVILCSNQIICSSIHLFLFIDGENTVIVCNITGRVCPVVARSPADREGPWFESYTGLTWISQGTRNESPRLRSTKVWIGTLRGLCLCKLDIPGRHMLAAHKTGSEIVPLRRPER